MAKSKKPGKSVTNVSINLLSNISIKLPDDSGKAILIGVAIIIVLLLSLLFLR